jgi:hypothetical protein
MNSDEMLNWLVDNFDEWPSTGPAIEMPKGWLMGFIQGYQDFYFFDEDKRQLIITKTDYIKEKSARNKVTASPSKYHVKNIWQNFEFIDFYQMYDMYKLGNPHEVGDSAIEHAWKKITVAGNRSGGKSKLQDLREAVDSLNRAIDDIESMQLSGNSG